ncbi:MAG: hypothetical protein DWH91_11505 [Planctomycetota bacterium]|nr:MAG: hypothetical protein DWH91_11505 [Planctomycetota bacterium]
MSGPAESGRPRPINKPARAASSKAAPGRSWLEIQQELFARTSSRSRQNLKASLPGLGVSLGIHLLLGLFFALIVLTVRQVRDADPLELGWATVAAKSAASESAPPVMIEAISLEDELRASAARKAAMAPVSGADPDAKPTVKPVDVTRTLENRMAPSFQRGPVGETSENARAALDRALVWIVKQQQADGHWMMTGPYPEGATSREADTDSGATALALLALLGDGNTPAAGKHAGAVKKGIDWLVSHQKSDGDLFDSQELGRSAHFYSHAQGTIALCETLALSGDESLRPAATQAVRFLVEAQNPSRGGWKYRALESDGMGDVSVTGWALMALHTARMARIEVPDQTFQLASSFLDDAQVANDDASQYRYRPDEPAQPEQLWSMTAEGLLCRQWLGWPRGYEAFSKGQAFLLSEVNAPVWAEGQRNVYAWYYTAQTLHNLGGDPWKNWFSRTQGLLLKHQAAGGKTGGSWHPTKPRGAFLEWSEGAGRLYFTVMCVLVLETPFRHAPIYSEPRVPGASSP